VRIGTFFALSPDRGNRVRVTLISPNRPVPAARRPQRNPPCGTKKNGRRAFALPAVVLL